MNTQALILALRIRKQARDSLLRAEYHALVKDTQEIVQGPGSVLKLVEKYPEYI